MFSEVIEVGFCFLFIFCLFILDILWKFIIRMSWRQKNPKDKANYNFIQKIYFQDIKYKLPKSIYILNFILSFLFCLSKEKFFVKMSIFDIFLF